MGTHAFDSFTRRAAAVSRRASLATLGGAALATTLAKPDVSEAKKSCGKKQRKKCKKSSTQCIDVGTAFCQGEPTCLSQIQTCCPECFSGGFVSCLAAIQPQM